MSVGWQEELRQRLVDRNTRESAYSVIIEQYRRLAQQTRLLKERNQSLLRAVGSVSATGSAAGAGSGDTNAVRNAYISSLEAQISSLRDEMAAVYRTQGQNTTRLLAMNDTLREKEEVSRLSSDELRRAKDEIAALKKKVDQHNELMAEKNDRLQTLHDEIQALELELNQVNERNTELKKDNASLLSRWLDKMHDEAERMNSANDFYEDMKNRGWNTESSPGGTGIDSRRRPSEDSESWSQPNAEDSYRHYRNGPLPELQQQNLLHLSPNG